jgi:hypothetical protein
LGTKWEQDWQYQPNAATMYVCEGSIVTALRSMPLSITATCFQYHEYGRRAGLKIRSPQGGVGSSPTFGTPTQRSVPTRREAAKAPLPQPFPPPGRANPDGVVRPRHRAPTRTRADTDVHQMLPKLLPDCYRKCSRPTRTWRRSSTHGIECPRPSAPASWRWSKRPRVDSTGPTLVVANLVAAYPAT